MYCSSCGASVAPNLIYCNHCGAKLAGAKGEVSKASEISPNTLLAAMVATFVFGMAAITMFLSAAKGGNAIAIAVLVISFLLILGLESLFMWLLLGRKKIGKESSASNRLSEQARKELYAAPARDFVEPVPSVTEQTTNLLEPIPRDQKSK